MGVTVTDMPTILRTSVYGAAEFRAMCVSSWRDAAYATSDGIRRSFRRYKSATNAEERAYLGWDVITAVFELTEMVATVFLSGRHPERFAVHQASNDEIEALFTSIRDNGVTAEEVRSILRLTGPRFDARAVRTLRVFESVVARIQQLLRDLAVFWLEHVEHARWFRHYPATLTPDETWLIDITSSEEDRAMANSLAEMPGAIEVVTLMKGTAFEHTLLREQVVVSAAFLGEAATQFVMTTLANSGLDPRAPRKTSLFPLFTEHLTDDERDLLFAAGSYIRPV